jgi:hypothetical protein
VGLFKAMKDLRGITKQARELQEQQQAQAGYQPGLGGMVSQMGDMIGQANQQLAVMGEQMRDQPRLLAEGIRGEAIIVAMGTPARGAAQFNLDLDLEVHLPGQAAYRVANDFLVPASAPLGPGARLPVAVDPADPAKIAIDWDRVAPGPARGVVREADLVSDLERLAKLRDSGALTDAEFQQQKTRMLGGT